MTTRRLLLVAPLLAVAAYWGGSGVTAVLAWEYTAPLAQQVGFLAPAAVVWAAGLALSLLLVNRRTGRCAS